MLLWARAVGGQFNGTGLIQPTSVTNNCLQCVVCSAKMDHPSAHAIVNDVGGLSANAVPKAVEVP
jgi:hypothetical protein